MLEFIMTLSLVIIGMIIAYREGKEKGYRQGFREGHSEAMWDFVPDPQQTLRESEGKNE